MIANSTASAILLLASFFKINLSTTISILCFLFFSKVISSSNPTNSPSTMALTKPSFKYFSKIALCSPFSLKTTGELIYILLNKPIGYVTTAKDQFNRDSVLDLVKCKKRLVPVGRLDMYTSGALILTNDGDFVYKVTHPKHEINKTYTVTVKGIVQDSEVEQLRNGVKIDDYTTKPAKVKILKTDEENNQSRLEITIHEGKNRQVRKMCEAVGRKVLALHRSKIGNIGVKDLELGKWRYLNSKEIQQLIK